MAVVMLSVLCALPAIAGEGPDKASPPQPAPELRMDGGRRLVFERSFESEREVKTKRSFWNKLVDAVAGAPDFHSLIRPYGVAIDSRGRIIVTDPGAGGVHIFDFAQQKYKFIARDSRKDSLVSPQCVALDRQDNIYVSDSAAGKIFVFDANGKLKRVFGSLPGGEGFYKRPTGIAVDGDAQRVYVSDTLRHKIFVLGYDGTVVATIGKAGDGPGEFNFPTELRLVGRQLIVVDALNFRIQVLDKDGTFRYAIGRRTESSVELYRPKGVGMDSEGHLYVVDGANSLVEVFDAENELLYYFGEKGTGLGEFQMPAGLALDGNDRIYVVDSYTRKVQVFRYFGASVTADGGRR
jgi:DNA-binding beta-propeller fold protein YncE